MKTQQRKEFYLRYFVGHKGSFGNEYIEFEFHPNGRFDSINVSNYKNESGITKKAFVSDLILEELQKMIIESEILREDDIDWPKQDRNGEQELEIVLNNYHISFNTCKLNSIQDALKSKDPEGLKKFYYLVHDIKAFALTLINLHFKKNPI